MVSKEGENVKELIGIELDKEVWEAVKGEKILIHVPEDTVLLLEE